MKRFFYSVWFKVILIAIVISLCVSVTDNIFLKIVQMDSQEAVYGFENSFEESEFFSYGLALPRLIVAERMKDESLREGESVVEASRKALEESAHSDNIEYFISIDGELFSNCGITDKSDFRQDGIYDIFERRPDGEIYESYSGNRRRYGNLMYGYLEELKGEILIYSRVSDEAYNEYEKVWLEQEKLIRDMIVFSVIAFFTVLLLLLLIIYLHGKDSNGRLKEKEASDSYTEVILGYILLSCVSALYLFARVNEAFFDGDIPLYLARMAIAGVMAVFTTAVALCIVSLGDKIKRKRIFKESIICAIIRKVFRIAVVIAKMLSALAVRIYKSVLYAFAESSILYTLGLLALYTVFVVCLGVAAADNWIIIAYIVFPIIGAVLFVVRRARDLDNIKLGVRMLQDNDFGYKINGIESEDMKRLADDINSLGEGLDEAVGARVRAERMKSELITNVSHDLKTPLTSIINYAGLLSEMENLPEEAADYIKIISAKSERLKNLTADLFEISKANSGSENIDFEKVDISLLVNQALGEHDKEIRDSGLNFVCDVEKEVFVYADGRKLSRVISNLIDNVLKYTMKNTRVFVSVKAEYSNAVVKFKNVASYPMNFSGEYIVERFARGDESRTGEGNGLGLAIAKSYTELCKGNLSVEVDGDVFTVNVYLPLI